MERQRAVLLTVDTEAEQESAINRELAHVMCARLDAARRATERLLGVLQVPLGPALPCQNLRAGFCPALPCLALPSSDTPRCTGKAGG